MISPFPLLALCLLTPALLLAQERSPTVLYGRSTLSGGRENEWLDLMGIEAEELTANISDPVFGVRLRIEVWEPGDTGKPKWSDTFTSGQFKEKCPLQCQIRIYFVPARLKEAMPPQVYPAWLVLKTNRGGEYAADNPTEWTTTHRIAFPENYLSLEGCQMNQSAHLYDARRQTFDRALPFFHYCAAHGPVAMRNTPEDTRKANPGAAHIIAWLEPILDKTSPDQRKPTSPAPEAEKAASPAPLPAVGSKAPTWELENLAGGKFSAHELEGKISVINFWTSWCGHCRVEMPGFAELQKEYGPKGVQFVGLNIDRELSVPALRRFLKWNYIEAPLNYPMLLAPPSIEGLFGGIAELPTTYLVDRSGKIVDGWKGEIRKTDLEKKIASLLAQ